MFHHTHAKYVIDALLGWLTRDRFPIKVTTLGALIMSASLLEFLAIAAGLWYKDHLPILNDDRFFTNTVGAVLLVIGIGCRFWFYYKDGTSNRTLKLLDFHGSYSTLDAAAKQIRFREIYGIQPDVLTTDLLMNHPTKPLQVVQGYVRCNSVIERSRDWFIWRSKRHNLYKNIYATVSIVMFLFGLFTLILGGTLWFAPSNGPYGEWVGPTLVAQGLLVIIGACLNFGDVSKYAAAKNLIAANPAAGTV